MTLAIKVFGVQDCIAAFGELPRIVRGRAMRDGLNKGGGIIRDAAVHNVPSEHGLAAKSLKVDVKTPELSHNPKHHSRPAYAKIGPSTRVIGVRSFTKSGRARKGFKTVRLKGRAFFQSTARRPARYFHILEKGSRPHTITTTGRTLASASGQIFGRTVRHPGTKAYRPLGRAVASHGEAAKAAVISKVRAGITEWAQKRAATGAWRSSIRSGAANPLGIGS